MKKLIFLLSIGLIFATSCSNNDDENLLSATSSETQCIIPTESLNEVDVTKTELSNIIKERAGHLTRSIDYSITPLKGEDGSVAMYVINYGNGQGWQIISASKNVEPCHAPSQTK